MRLLECILNFVSVIGQKLSADTWVTSSQRGWVPGATCGGFLACSLPQAQRRQPGSCLGCASCSPQHSGRVWDAAFSSADTQ